MKDRYIELRRCHYCGRPGVTAWDVDLFTCRSEVCESLAFAEVTRRDRNGLSASTEERNPPLFRLRTAGRRRGRRSGAARS